MSHYFTNDNNLKSDIKKREAIINGEVFSFFTDNGVFSKHGLDFATKCLLETIDLTKISGNVLDFGCGYGPIGIYLSKKTNAHIDMLDINKRSMELARKNASLNNVNVNIFESNIYENVTKKYDFIVTNPPIRVGKEILYKILFGAKDYLTSDGELWLVINKNHGAKSLVRDLENVYKVDIVDKIKGFYIIRCKNN